jgi:hypothetical protein
MHTRRKMMVYLYIRQTVADFALWKEVFDHHLAARQAGGATREALVLRNADNPQEVIVVLGWRNLTQARLFTKSVSWQVAMEQMGVAGFPEVCFLEAES